MMLIPQIEINMVIVLNKKRIHITMLGITIMTNYIMTHQH